MALASMATAHPILVAKPSLTLADRVLLSDVLVLGREDPERPFHYTTVKTLKGDAGTPAIDLFIPSQLRRQLANNPESTVLLGRDSISDDWYSMGLATEDYLQVVAKALASADQWAPRETDNLQRLQAFSPLLGHADLRLHELAYVEIGRASYASIRQVGTDVSMDRVRQMHNNPVYFKWRGLDIMLLGLSDEPQDREWVVGVMENNQRFSVDSHLAAWATAYVEVTGRPGVNQLTQWYFRDDARSRAEVRSVARALAGHANYAPELRPLVVAAYREMLNTHPGAAPDIAHDLIAWQQWDFAPRIQQLQPELARRDPLGVYKVNLYLQKAKRHAPQQ